MTVVKEEKVQKIKDKHDGYIRDTESCGASKQIPRILIIREAQSSITRVIGLNISMCTTSSTYAARSTCVGKCSRV